MFCYEVTDKVRGVLGNDCRFVACLMIFLSAKLYFSACKLLVIVLLLCDIHMFYFFKTNICNYATTN